MPSDDEIRQILKEPGVSHWIKKALTTALDRDPVDAARDAELLAVVLKHRLDQIIASEVADLHIELAMRKARHGGQ